jgi:hypothetical protein
VTRGKTHLDILEHRLLTFSHWKPESSWTFIHKNGKDKETVAFQPFLTMNDYTGLAPALVAGGGIGELPPVVQPELMRKGHLVEVIPDWRFRSFDLSLVHLGNRHISKPCRLFKEFATQMAPTLFPSLPTWSNEELSDAQYLPRHCEVPSGLCRVRTSRGSVWSIERWRPMRPPRSAVIERFPAPYGASGAVSRRSSPGVGRS